ncbi:MAG: DNA primase [Alphaproteobacteria bacterium 16-39-46]|nr:MAG: DNA primase [Alphaproteobacteria bacterium 16-39-46]OZA43975.1 MAG: DNA primase [Alphaproteobacteria bacterium 17-39-52]HQS83444.1 DNA primase [Alphaproteobacteria bacterium]HQS93238.1 DNA primase [Alphaproteobacteria bacterium]
MRYNQTLLDQIRSTVILSDFISEKTSLRRQGQYHVGLCPFHHEKTPSFTVTNDKGIYFCFGCGETGSIFDFLMKIKGLNFKEAVEEAANRVGILLPAEVQSPMEEKAEKENLEIYHALERATIWFQSQLQGEFGKEGRHYLEGRGVPKALQEEFKLGFAPSSSQGLLTQLKKEGLSEDILEKAGLIFRKNELPNGGQKETRDRFRGRLMFPIQDKKGRVIAFGARTLTNENPKYLNSPETAVFHKGKSLYGVWNVMRNKESLKKMPLMVVEGYLDVILCWKEGLPAVAPLGTALTETQLSEVWRFYSEPILCFDGDLAGRKAAFRAGERALIQLKPGISLKIAHFPKGEDPASLLSSGQRGVVTDLLKNADGLDGFLWQYLIEEKRTDTPEHQALLKKDLFKMLDSILDKDVREAYYHDMMSRYHGMFRGGGRGRLKEVSQKSTYFGKRRDLPSSFEVKKRQHKILIAGLIKYPFLLNDVVDIFSTLDLEDPDLIKLREVILRYYEKNLPLEFLDMEGYLKEKNCMDVLLQLKNDNLFLDASFLREGTEIVDVKRGWREVWILAQEQKNIKREETKLLKEFETNMSPHLWAEIQALNIEKESQKAFIREGLETETE